MRALSLVLICFITLFSCDEKTKDNKKIYLPDSNGNLNNISVVVDNLLWENNVGEEIRAVFAAPLNGLAIEEPMFKMRQIPPQVFNGFTTRSRIILKIEKGSEEVEASTSIVNNVYAKPQTVAVVKGKTNAAIIAQLKETKSKIIDAYNKEEVKEKLRRVKLSLLKDEVLESKLGITIDLPSAYRIAKESDDFFWIRKNLDNSKTMELMVYEVPSETISKGDSTIVDIVKMRNGITKTKIPGEDDIYMAVEDTYAPALYETIIDNKPAYEVRGLWKMVGHTMGGPFITYVIEDTINKRFLVADGYVYAPSLEKRKYIFELESLIKSIKIK